MQLRGSWSWLPTPSRFIDFFHRDLNNHSMSVRHLPANPQFQVRRMQVYLSYPMEREERIEICSPWSLPVPRPLQFTCSLLASAQRASVPGLTAAFSSLVNISCAFKKLVSSLQFNPGRCDGGQRAGGQSFGDSQETCWFSWVSQSGLQNSRAPKEAHSREDNRAFYHFHFIFKFSVEKLFVANCSRYSAACFPHHHFLVGSGACFKNQVSSLVICSSWACRILDLHLKQNASSSSQTDFLHSEYFVYTQQLFQVKCSCPISVNSHLLISYFHAEGSFFFL